MDCCITIKFTLHILVYQLFLNLNCFKCTRGVKPSHCSTIKSQKLTKFSLVTITDTETKRATLLSHTFTYWAWYFHMKISEFPKMLKYPTSWSLSSSSYTGAWRCFSSLCIDFRVAESNLGWRQVSLEPLFLPWSKLFTWNSFIFLSIIFALFLTIHPQYEEKLVTVQTHYYKQTLFYSAYIILFNVY